MGKNGLFEGDAEQRRRQSQKRMSDTLVAELTKTENSLFMDVVASIKNLHSILSRYDVPKRLLVELEKLPASLQMAEERGESYEDYEEMEIIFVGLEEKLFSKLTPKVGSSPEVLAAQIELRALEDQCRHASVLVEKLESIIAKKGPPIYSVAKLNLEGIHNVVNCWVEESERHAQEVDDPKKSQEPLSQQQVTQLTELQLETKDVQRFIEKSRETRLGFLQANPVMREVERSIQKVESATQEATQLRRLITRSEDMPETILDQFKQFQNPATHEEAHARHKSELAKVKQDFEATKSPSPKR